MPTEAALSGKSSNVKLTIGCLWRSRNGALQKYRDRRLLTRAFNVGQSVCAAIPVTRRQMFVCGEAARAFLER